MKRLKIKGLYKASLKTAFATEAYSVWYNPQNCRMTVYPLFRDEPEGFNQIYFGCARENAKINDDFCPPKKLREITEDYFLGFTDQE